ncbi:MAG: PQQ-binding-like beta-propeller repeat protein [Planctomycetota bacterium]
MLTANRKHLQISILGVAISLLASTCRAGDWPQWRGPNRDGICTETGLLKSWPEDGPKLLWELAGLGRGYSSLAIVDGRFYTMGDVSVESGKKQCILAYDLSTHERLWAAEVGKTHDDGPRCTPTVDGGLVYAVGTEGNVVCVSADNGEQRWSKNLQKDLGGKNPGWRFSESPLVDGDKLVCTPGGRDSVMAALDKKTGDVVWKSSMPDIGPKGKDEAGYSSVIAADIVGVRQYVQLTNKGLVGVAAKDGRFLWGYNRIANKTANISTPVVCGDSVFCSTAYGTGSALIKLTNTGDGVSAQEVYFLEAGTFQNHHGGFVRIGEHIYGGHGHGAGKPSCVEVETGNVVWQADQPGGGSAAVLYADGHLYFRYQDDVLALIEANPHEYRLKSKFKLPKRKGMSGNGWAHPVIVDGKLYVRHADVLLVYDVKARGG